MIKATRSFTRPNADVPFYDGIPQYHVYVENMYINTGKRITTVKTTSPDSLTLTISVAWKDQASLDEFNNDPRIIAFHHEPRKTYNEHNGITESEQTVVEI